MAETKARTAASTAKRTASRASASKSTPPKSALSKTGAAKQQTARKTATAKTTVSKRKPAAAKKGNGRSRDARQIMIAEAAYYRSERRGFLCGYETEDWLQAELEIDSFLGGRSSA